ncbi:hypothetical protein PIROE2DRAFT_10944 [Piromyces sp. E2]|nr:hypothetical protein PIROE2DRAFT_10944 [Piromyces sp. E2]|eukprot:OUM62685.1 hypothetical protein PIROE2DRAFT_10944 [Piromyces sp. E2]
MRYQENLIIIPPLAGICATQQIKCFIKWRNSNCIIGDLVRDIPTMSSHSLYSSWIKESKSLSLRYSNLQFKNSTTSIIRLGFQKTLYHNFLELSGSFAEQRHLNEQLYRSSGADVVSIGHRNLTLVPYTGSDVRNSLNDNINDLMGEFRDFFAT